jgi:hypothetical protein
MTDTNTKTCTEILSLLEATLDGEGVDLDGCTTADDIRTAIERDAPEMMETALLGDGLPCPAIRDWLSERSDDITAAIAARDAGTECYHCSLTLDAEECGRAEHEAHWIDADGKVSEGTYHVCSACLEAGSPQGPGYRTVEE